MTSVFTYEQRTHAPSISNNAIRIGRLIPLMWYIFKSGSIALRCMPVHESLKRLLLLSKMSHRRSCSFEMLGRCYLKTYAKAETLRPVVDDELELL